MDIKTLRLGKQTPKDKDLAKSKPKPKKVSPAYNRECDVHVSALLREEQNKVDNIRQQCENYVSPEDFQPNTKYPITINPSEQHWGQDTQRIRSCHNSLCEEFKRLRYCKFDLVAEVSAKGRVHYHGTIEAQDVLHFFLYDLPKFPEFCIYSIKEWMKEGLGKFKKWDDYLGKQAPLFIHNNDIHYRDIKYECEYINIRHQACLQRKED